VIALAITTALSFLFAEELMLVLARPLGPGGISQLTVIEPTEAVGVFMRVSLLAGVAFAMPWIVLELYLFVAPGLMPRSRVLLLLAIPTASLLFVLGMAFTYFVMLPTAIPFLANFLDFQASWRPSAYFGLVTSLMFWIGIAFQMPLVVYALAAVGLLNARQLAQQWRVAVVVSAILAAMVTPTVDPVNMALVMAPMFALYLFSILGAAVAGAGRRRAAARRPLQTG
jgi:sec-independent protein translocase protein TatC